MTATLPVYLDYMATTPVDPRVAEAMLNYLGPQGVFGNPASVTHAYGLQARKAVEVARAQVAELINAEPREIIWTSGATESDNLAIKGAARFYRRNGNHIITCKTEHKAVLDSCQQLEKEGFKVTYLEPETNGLIDLATLKNAIQDDTILISIMHVNNEIGVIQDIAAIGEVAKAHGIVFHVDAAQAAGKISIDVKTLPVDLMSFSGHKAYGPKGIGALFVKQKPRVRLEAMIHGGGHENGLRSGTLATHQIVGMGEAFKIAKDELSQEVAQITKLRDYFWEGIKEIEAMTLNGDAVWRIPGNLNLSFAFVEGDSLILALKDLAISSGSACSSASIEPSYVLRAIGVPSALAHASVRISLGRFTTQAEIDIAIATIKEQVARLRAISTEG